ncbi:uncharacterized protein LOC110896125 isoform X3 [Helianthus annuus]|uniref:uncharacterized protein LOC110896125 isoform X3 n=1 Tax=Helianthus annuus TaxID=4232 RepID=UPI000B902A8A|nr:uncharacterized protein LOC110896125 isoform X3 [Helianthus annuus]
MACCRVLPFRTLMLTELRRVSSKATPFPFSLSFVVNQISTTTPPRCRITRRMHHRFNCSHHDENLSSTEDDGDQEPPQEAVLKVISVTDDSSDEWLTLDQKVNTYPTVRGFTAIGTGGDDFVQAMVIAVESVVQHPIPQGNVKQKMSSGGKYVSVNIGPVQVVSSEQVQAVYNAMRRDVRMKYFL